MVNAHDVAAYVLEKLGRMTTMKLQKLVYYAQAWSLVWDDKPLFRNRIEAWANGPVIPDLYRIHRGEYEVRSWPKGDSGRLNSDQRDTVDAVIGYYGHRTSQWLSALTHSEAPWRDARDCVPAGAFCDEEITTGAMAEYYSGLSPAQ
jgi:uncharacterized phage-associated protein